MSRASPRTETMSILRTPHSALESVTVVGPGRLGRSIARALRAAGVVVHGPVGRGEEIPDAPVVLLCVPDGEIAAAAHAATAAGRMIGHTSGAVPIHDVDFGLHPLQTFTGDDDPAVFRGVACAVAARSDEALETATGIALLLGARAFPLDEAHRAAYHAAASVAANFLVTIADAAERIAETAGIPAKEARLLLAPLVRRTVENWASGGPATALTGPIARGDEETVERQRAAISAGRPELVPLFDELCEATRALARRKEHTT
ncbi:DUF2520 domain-containing protein [Microbacterium sp. JZ101]